MAWDFSTEPEFERKLQWMREFVRTQVWPLETLRDELGFGQIISLMGVGDMPHYRTVKSMELFATQVMPALRRRSSEAREAAPA